MSKYWIPTGCSYQRKGKRAALRKAVLPMTMRADPEYEYPVATNQCMMTRLYLNPLSMRELTLGLVDRVVSSTNITDGYLTSTLLALAHSGLHSGEEVQLTFLVLYAYFPLVRDALHGHVNEATEFLAPVYISARYIALISMLPPAQTRRRLTASWARSVLQPMYHEDYTTMFLGCERAVDSLLFNNSLCEHVLGYCHEAHSALDTDEWFSFEYDSTDHVRVYAEYRALAEAGPHATAHPDQMLAAAKELTWATQLLHTQLVFVLQRTKPGSGDDALVIDDPDEHDDPDPDSSLLCE